MRRALSPFIAGPFRRPKSADAVASSATGMSTHQNRPASSVSRRPSGRPKAVSQIERDAFNEGILLMQSPQFLKALADQTPAPTQLKRRVELQREGRSRTVRSPLAGSAPKRKNIDLRRSSDIETNADASAPRKVDLPKFIPKFSKKQSMTISAPNLPPDPVETSRTTAEVVLANKRVLFSDDLTMQRATAVSMLRQAGGTPIQPEKQLFKTDTVQADFIVTRDGVIRPQQLQSFLPFMVDRTEVISELDFLDAFDSFLNSSVETATARGEGQDVEPSPSLPITPKPVQDIAVPPAAVSDRVADEVTTARVNQDLFKPQTDEAQSEWTPHWNSLHLDASAQGPLEAKPAQAVSPEAQSLYQKLVSGHTPDSIERLNAAQHRKGLEDLDDELAEMNRIVSNVKKKKQGDDTKGKQSIPLTEGSRLSEPDPQLFATEQSRVSVAKSDTSEPVTEVHSPVTIQPTVEPAVEHRPIVTDLQAKLHPRRHVHPPIVASTARLHDLVAPTIPSPRTSLKRQMDLRIRKTRRYTMNAAPFPGDVIDRRRKFEDPHVVQDDREISPSTTSSVIEAERSVTTVTPSHQSNMALDWEGLDSMDETAPSIPTANLVDHPPSGDHRSAVDLQKVYEDLLNLGGAELLETMESASTGMSAPQQHVAQQSYQDAIRAAMPENSISGVGRRENGAVNQTVASTTWEGPASLNPINKTFAGDMIDLHSKKIGFTGIFSRALPADMIQQILRDSHSSSISVVTPETSFVVYGKDPRGQVVNAAMKYDVPLVSERDFLASYAQSLSPSPTTPSKGQVERNQPEVVKQLCSYPSASHAGKSGRLAKTEDTISQLEAQLKRLEAKLSIREKPAVRQSGLETKSEPELEQKAFQPLAEKLSLQGRNLCFLETEERELGLNPVTAVEWAVRAGADVDYEFIPGKTDLVVSFSGLIPTDLKGKIPRGVQVISVPKFIVASR